MYTEKAPLTLLGKTNFLTGGFAIYYLFLLSYSFPRIIFKLKPPILTLISGETIILSLVTMFTPFIDQLESVKDGTLVTTYGHLYFWFILHFVGLMLASLLILFVKFRRSSSFEKQQLKFLFLGMSLTTGFAVITNLFIPLLFGYYDLQFFGPVGTVFMIGAVGYAIIRHRLMDIRLVVARSVAYLLLIIVLGTFYAGGLFLASAYVFKQSAPAANLGLSTTLALIIAFSFRPLLALFERITNRIFYKERYDESVLLHELTLIMASKLRLTDLTSDLLQKILAEMRITRGAFILIDKGRIIHLNRQGYPGGPQFVPKFSEDELRKLVSLTEITVFDELPETSPKELLRKLEISVVVPLRTKKEKEDFLILGEKLSGDPYTDQDIRLLEIFAPQAAIAVENASTFEQLFALDEAKSEFITVVSHQLRTPLSVARWDFELLLENAFGEIPPKAKKIVGNVYDSLMVLNHGLNNMMLAIEIEENKSVLNLEEVDFKKEIVESVLKLLGVKIKKREVKVEVEVGFSEPIKVDRRKLKSVLEILIDNAIEYSGVASTIRVTAKLQEKRGRKEYLIAVSDQGIGISPVDKEKIGQKFYRGERAKKAQPNGFGLGLFIAKAFVWLHGGNLLFENQKPYGSIFYFTVPYEPAKIKSDGNE